MSIRNTHCVGEYKIIGRISAGAFGEIFQGEHVGTKEKSAIKLEKKIGTYQLRHEYKIYVLLQSENKYVSRVHYMGMAAIEGVKREMLVLDLLGPSLESLFNYCDRKFSLKTVLMLADMLVTRIEYMHYKNVVHRDVKPENFVFGVQFEGNEKERIAKDALYVIDFGLSIVYRTSTYAHIAMETGKKLIGTVRYSSLNTHNGISQSRRDDLESLAYMLIYFMKGELPWQNLKDTPREAKYRKIGALKMSIPVETLCEGLDESFGKFLRYTRELRYDQMPDYFHIKEIFSSAMIRNNIVYDFDFDWFLKFSATNEPIRRNMKKNPGNK